MDTPSLIATLLGLLLIGLLVATTAWYVRKEARRGEEMRRMAREILRLEEAVRAAHVTLSNHHDRLLVREAGRQSGSNQMTVDSNACNIAVRSGPGGTPIGVSVSEPISEPTPGFPPDFTGGG